MKTAILFAVLLITPIISIAEHGSSDTGGVEYDSNSNVLQDFKGIEKIISLSPGDEKLSGGGFRMPPPIRRYWPLPIPMRPPMRPLGL